MLYDNLSVNEKGHLTFAGLDTVDLAGKYGTPLFLMDEKRIRERCRVYKNALSENAGEGSIPLFAGKALCFKALYHIIREEGLGIDVVSPGEIYTAHSAGFPMEKAFFHGNNKTPWDIAFAMECGVGYFVCDNGEELRAVSEEAERRGIKQKILIRLSPGIDPHTHAKISTGKVDSKFGAPIVTGQAEVLCRLALSLDGVELTGFHCHIGSQIFESEPFTDAAKIMMSFAAEMKNSAGFETKILNIGGGMGVPYTEKDPAVDYAENIKKIAGTVKAEAKALGIPAPALLMEPGRSIVADAGSTLYTVGGKKEIPDVRNYVSVDGGMTDNPRYTLYSAEYTACNATCADKPADYVCTVAGRCCESGDLIGENMKIAEPVPGDLLAVFTTGAYNYSMASNYNAIPKPPIVMINGAGEDRVAVARETFEHMTENQI